MNWLLAILTALAVARLTRLITADYLTRGLRARASDRFGAESNTAYLLTCDYCASIWIAAPVAAGSIYWHDERLWWVAMLALAASQIAGLIPRLDS